MKIKLLYFVLFYKLYKIGSWTRTDEEASFAACVGIGFLPILWVGYIFAAIDLKELIPKTAFWLLIFLNLLGNTYFIMRKRNYERIIKEMRSNKIPVLFHIIVYVLLSWTFIGILFL